MELVLISPGGILGVIVEMSGNILTFRRFTCMFKGTVLCYLQLTF